MINDHDRRSTPAVLPTVCTVRKHSREVSRLRCLQGSERGKTKLPLEYRNYIHSTSIMDQDGLFLVLSMCSACRTAKVRSSWEGRVPRVGHVLRAESQFHGPLSSQRLRADSNKSKLFSLRARATFLEKQPSRFGY